MRWSLPISVLMHLAILLAAVVVLPRPDPFRVKPQEALPVEIVDITEVSRRVSMRKSAPEKPVKKPAPPKPEKQAKAPRKPAPKPAKRESRPEPKPRPKPAPAPKPQPVEKAKAEPAPKKAPEPPDAEALKKLAAAAAKPEPEPEPKPKTKPKKAEKPRTQPAPRPRVRPRAIRQLARQMRQKREEKKPQKKPQDPIDEIAALLNKVDEERAAPETPVDRAGTPMKGPADIDGRDAQLAADLVDALRSRIEQCWNVPVGVRDAQGLRVKVRFQLGPGGKVMGGPVVLNRMNHPAFDAAANSAVRAVLACQPYDFLPPEHYELWQDVILNFDPARMLATN